MDGLTPAELLWRRRLAESRENGTYWQDPDPGEETEREKERELQSAPLSEFKVGNER